MQYEKLLKVDPDTTDDPLSLSEAMILSSGLGVCKACELFLRSYTIRRRAVGVVYTQGVSHFLAPLFRFLAASNRGHLYISSSKLKSTTTADVFVFPVTTFVSEIVRGELSLSSFDGFLVLTAGKPAPLLKALAPALRENRCWIKYLSDQPLMFVSVQNLYKIQVHLEQIEAFYITAVRVVHRSMQVVLKDLDIPSPPIGHSVLDATHQRGNLFIEEVISVDVGLEHPTHSRVWQEIRRWSLLLAQKQPRYEAIARLPQAKLIKHADLLFADEYISWALWFLYHIELALPQHRLEVLKCYGLFLDQFKHPLIRPADIRNYYDSLQAVCGTQGDTALITAITKAVESASEDIVASIEAYMYAEQKHLHGPPTRIVVLLGTYFAARELEECLISNGKVEILSSQSEDGVPSSELTALEPVSRKNVSSQGSALLTVPVEQVGLDSSKCSQETNAPELNTIHRHLYLQTSINKESTKLNDNAYVPFTASKGAVIDALTKSISGKIHSGIEVVIISTVSNPLFSIRSMSTPFSLYDRLDQLGMDTIASIICCGASIQAVRVLERLNFRYKQEVHQIPIQIPLTVIEGGVQSFTTNYPILVNNVESEALKVLHTASMHMSVSSYYNGLAETDVINTQTKQHNLNKLEDLQCLLYIDNRELRSIVPVELFVLSKGVRLIVRQLTLGDYILSSMTAVERKSEQDLISSLRNNRLEDQLERLNAQFSTFFLMCSIPPEKPHNIIQIDVQDNQSTTIAASKSLSLTARLFKLMRTYKSMCILWSTDAAFAPLLMRLKRACMDRGEPELEPADAENMISVSDEFIRKRVVRAIPDLSEADYATLVQKYSGIYSILMESGETLARETNQYVRHKVASIATEPLTNLLKVLSSLEA
ncbi:Hypothetical protein GLP15_1931 [Giardia lamblia P15]|uniref:ERCC4 domain-containing protein n=1 Tax=Giardia intestinalis (strain P15) TaxID=658858 RepID=E1F632_GIAIA|nr:Hypothetical protein GLP15_1931 [Giardia lamblia P15]